MVTPSKARKPSKPANSATHSIFDYRRIASSSSSSHRIIVGRPFMQLGKFTAYLR
jgi:hypothetical protein